jgi:GMP synthase-like glutamine amidotransferase
MNPVLIVRHAASEGPGYLAEWLDERGTPRELLALDEGRALPTRPDGYAALVFMGGPMSVNDPLPWVADALALIRRAQGAGVPVLGHCLGAQLLAKALGGQVVRNPVPEIGWLPVEAAPTREAAVAVAEGWLPAAFEAFHWHGETFSLPDGAAWLLRSADCPHQAFALGRSLGLQFHIEMTAPMVRAWAAGGSDELARPSATVQSPTAMTARLDERVAALRAVAGALYARWWLDGCAREGSTPRRP